MYASTSFRSAKKKKKTLVMVINFEKRWWKIILKKTCKNALGFFFHVEGVLKVLITKLSEIQVAPGLIKALALEEA